MVKVLVTGCSGYIGSHLCKMLAEYGHDVTGLDIARPSNDIPMNDFIHDDIVEVGKIKDFDTIIHLAALVRVGESKEKPFDYYMTNLFGTMRLLYATTPHFIFASTGAAEFCESPYATSKRAAEDLIRVSKDHTIFRFYNVVGSDGFKPTNPDGLMMKLMEAGYHGKFTIYGNDYSESHDGTAIRDYVHVNEICSAIVRSIDNGPTNTIECLGHGVGHTVKEMVELFKEVNGVDFEVEYGPRRLGDAPVTVLKDVSRFMVKEYDIKDLLRIDTGQ